MDARPDDKNLVKRYLEYLSSRKFNPILLKLAGTPYGRVVLTLVTALSGIGFPIAVFQAWKVLTHRSQYRKSLIAVARRGRPIMTFPLMVNSTLTTIPGSIAPGMVIGSFESNPEMTTDYWVDLALELDFMLLDPEPGKTPEEQRALRWLSDQRYVESQRIRLPTSLTGGYEVYAFHLKIIGDYFPSGLIDIPMIPCIAVPGNFGAIQHIPWWIATDEPAPL